MTTTHIHGFYGVVAALLLATALLVLNASPVHAAVVRGGEAYELAADATLESDLYFAGEKLTVSGTTTGDIIAVGAGIWINGTTTDDITVAGGRVTLGGSVDGDVRVAAGEASIVTHVGEDLVIAAGNVHLEEGTVIDGDLLILADHVRVVGDVQGTVEIRARTVELSGTFGHDVTVRASESLSIMGSSTIAGKLSYEAPHEAVISETVAVLGDLRYEPLERTGGTIDAFGLMLNMLVGVVAATLLLYLFPQYATRVVHIAFAEGGMTAFKGLVLVVGLPIVAVLAMVTVLGVIPGMVLFFGYGAAVALALALAPLIAGAILARVLKQDTQLTWAWASLGAISLTMLSMVPFLGMFVKALIFLVAFGAVAVLAYEAVRGHMKRTISPTDDHDNVEQLTTAGKESSTA